MTIRASIETLVLSGAYVSHPYKAKYSEWVATVAVRQYADPDHEFASPRYIVDDGTLTWFEDVATAVDHFCRLVYSPKNLALVARGAFRHGLGEMDFRSNLSGEERRKLNNIARRYRRGFFALDYPEFASG